MFFEEIASTLNGCPGKPKLGSERMRRNSVTRIKQDL